DHRRVDLKHPTETLQIQFERLAVGRLKLHAIYKCSDVRRTRRYGGCIEIGFEPVEFARPGGEVERQILSLLEDANLSFFFSGDSARRDVRDSTRGKSDARICDIEHWCQDRYADGRYLPRPGTDKRQ